MFTHMRFIKKDTHQAHRNMYELLVYQVNETNEYRIYISKAGDGVGDIYTATQEIVSDAEKISGANMVEELISIAKDDIVRNEHGYY